MRFQGLDLNLLVVLDALLQERSVTGAARRLHVSQPAISAALKKLRDHTGDQILEQVGRRQILTARAGEMAAQVKELLLQIQATLSPDSAFDPRAAQRTFNIGMSTYAAAVLAPSIAARLTEAGPGLSCFIQEIGPQSLPDLQQGNLDLCVMVSTWQQTDVTQARNGFLAEHLYIDDFILVTSAANRAVKAGLSYDAFCELPYVATHFNGVRSVPEQVLDRLGRRPLPRMSVPNFALALAVVAETNMVTLVPSLLARDAARLGLKAIPPPFRTRGLDEHVVWHARSNTEPGHAWLRALVHQVAEHLTFPSDELQLKASRRLPSAGAARKSQR